MVEVSSLFSRKERSSTVTRPPSSSIATPALNRGQSRISRWGQPEEEAVADTRHMDERSSAAINGLRRADGSVVDDSARGPRLMTTGI